jgi:hypothetical protein
MLPWRLVGACCRSLEFEVVTVLCFSKIANIIHRKVRCGSVAAASAAESHRQMLGKKLTIAPQPGSFAQGTRGVSGSVQKSAARWKAPALSADTSREKSSPTCAIWPWHSWQTRPPLPIVPRMHWVRLPGWQLLQVCPSMVCLTIGSRRPSCPSIAGGMAGNSRWLACSIWRLQPTAAREDSHRGNGIIGGSAIARVGPLP